MNDLFAAARVFFRFCVKMIIQTRRVFDSGFGRGAQGFFSVFLVLSGFLSLSWAAPALSQDSAGPAHGETIEIAVIGGTTFGHPPAFGEGLVEVQQEFRFMTGIGISPTVYEMRYKGVPFYYIQIYGADAEAAGDPEYTGHIRAWVALYELGVKYAFGGATAGGIDPDMDYADLVIPDDFIIFQNQRPQNILSYAGIERPGVFASFAEPFTEEMRQLLIEKSKAIYPGTVIETGVFVQADPGRFETPAEIRMMRLVGGNHVSMNQATNAIYARQLGIAYAALNSVSNPAVGVRPFSFEQMQTAVQQIAEHSVPIVLESIVALHEIKDTIDQNKISEEFTGSYLKPADPGED